MLRHSRDMVRHHRERIIKNRKKFLDRIWFREYDGALGALSKYSFHAHRCEHCNPRYNRAKEKRIEQRERAAIN